MSKTHHTNHHFGCIFHNSLVFQIRLKPPHGDDHIRSFLLLLSTVENQPLIGGPEEGIRHTRISGVLSAHVRRSFFVWKKNRWIDFLVGAQSSPCCSSVFHLKGENGHPLPICSSLSPAQLIFHWEVWKIYFFPRSVISSNDGIPRQVPFFSGVEVTDRSMSRVSTVSAEECRSQILFWSNSLWKLCDSKEIRHGLDMFDEGFPDV